MPPTCAVQMWDSSLINDRVVRRVRARPGNYQEHQILAARLAEAMLLPARKLEDVARVYRADLDLAGGVLELGDAGSSREIEHMILSIVVVQLVVVHHQDSEL